MTNRKKRGTAAEVMAALQLDPAFVARETENAEQERANVAEYRAAAAELLEALAEAGFAVGSVGELRHRGLDYRAVIGLLLEWLPRVTHRHVKEDIVRALSVPWTSSAKAVPVLVAEFEREGASEPVKWAIGNALEVVADSAASSELLRLAMDPRHGQARQMIVQGLARLPSERTVVVALIGLLDDGDVAAHAAFALGKLGARDARPYLERLCLRASGLLKTEAGRALRSLA